MQASSPMEVRTTTSRVALAYLPSRLSAGIFREKLTGVLAIVLEELLDLVSNLAVGKLDIVLEGAVIRHEGKEVVVGDVELERPCQQNSTRAGGRGDLRAGTQCA